VRQGPICWRERCPQIALETNAGRTVKARISRMRPRKRPLPEDVGVVWGRAKLQLKKSRTGVEVACRRAVFARGGFPDFGMHFSWLQTAPNRPTAGQEYLVVSTSPAEPTSFHQTKKRGPWEEACVLSTSSRRPKSRDFPGRRSWAEDEGASGLNWIFENCHLAQSHRAPRPRQLLDLIDPLALGLISCQLHATQHGAQTLV
jgi:hypothetical protein